MSVVLGGLLGGCGDFSSNVYESMIPRFWSILRVVAA